MRHTFSIQVLVEIIQLRNSHNKQKYHVEFNSFGTNHRVKPRTHDDGDDLEFHTKDSIMYHNTHFVIHFVVVIILYLPVLSSSSLLNEHLFGLFGCID